MKQIALQIFVMAVISVAAGLLWNSVSAKGITLSKYIVRAQSDTPPQVRGTPQLVAAEPDKILVGKEWTEDELTFISLKTAIEYHNDEIAVFVDARKPAEYKEGHIPNAVSLFHDRSDRLIEGVKEELQARPFLIVYCGGGDCEMSKDLATDLIGLYGFDKESVYVLGGGLKLWEFNDLPIVEGSERGERAHINFPDKPRMPPPDDKPAASDKTSASDKAPADNKGKK